MYAAKLVADHQPTGPKKKRTSDDSESDGDDADPDARRSLLTIAPITDGVWGPNPRSATG